MYGTIAKYRVKPGHGQALEQEFDSFQASPPEGFVANTVYRNVDDPNEIWIAAVFESEAQYRANAGSPEMDQRFRAMLEHLEAEPEWHDGHVIRHNVKAGATA